MAGAPASSHTDWERAVAAALADIASRPGRLASSVIATRTVAERSAAWNSADDRRTLAGGVHPAQHDAASAFSGRQGGVEEDDRDDRVTTAAD
jgi:hypothetical protein